MDSLNIGKLYLRQGDFKTARFYFEKVISDNQLILGQGGTPYRTVADIQDETLEAHLLLGRVAIESEDHFLLKILLANVQNAEKCNPTQFIYQKYLYGLARFYESDHQEAAKIFEDCVNLSLEHQLIRLQTISLMMLIKTGLYLNESFRWIEQKLKSLEKLMQASTQVELWTHYYITLASVDFSRQSYDGAEKWALCALENGKKEQDCFLFVAILILMAEIQIQQNKFELAENGLKIARSMLDKDTMKRMLSKVLQLQKLIRQRKNPHITFYEKASEMDCGGTPLKLGRQLVLKELLLLFLKNPGLEFTKEQIVKNIWQQEYDPEVHDNLIYVTIRRLRHLLRNEKFSQIIQKSKYGYQMNPHISVEFK